MFITFGLASDQIKRLLQFTKMVKSFARLIAGTWGQCYREMYS
jgi:hypothetical protein